MMSEQKKKKKKKEDMLTNETVKRKHFRWKKSSNLPESITNKNVLCCSSNKYRTESNGKHFF